MEWQFIYTVETYKIEILIKAGTVSFSEQIAITQCASSIIWPS